jgi:hypothetical protein
MPETTPYLILGLVVVTVIMAGFVASIVIRYRNLEKDAEMIEQLKNG